MDHKRFSITSSGSTLKMSNKQHSGRNSGGGGGVGFTSYFRKKKQKGTSSSHRRGEKEMEKQRMAQRLAQEKLREVLAPVEFSQEEEERLRELKQYKQWKRMQQDRYRELRRRETAGRSAAAIIMPAIPETSVVAAHGEEEERRGRLPLNHRHHHPPINGEAAAAALGPGVAAGGGGLAKRTMAALHEHTWEQRIAIVSTLMTLLFVSLHSDSIARKALPPSLFLDNSLVPWYIIVLKDCGIFCHMSVCSLIHFALCDISLIYAFESMELGTKTGPKVKEYYREKVHVVVAAISGGIVALSICKALLVAWFRMLRDLLETAMALIGLGKDAFVSVLQTIVYISTSLINGIINFLNTIMTTPPSQWITSLCNGLARIITGICIWILAVVIPFDGDDRPLLQRVIKLATENITTTTTNNYHYTTTTTTTTTTSTTMMTMIDAVTTATSSLLSGGGADNHGTQPQYEQQQLGGGGDDDPTNLSNDEMTVNVTYQEGTPSLAAAATTTAAAATTTIIKPITWREDAFETCQWLLSHSAFFLITFLVAMHFLTSSYRHKIKTNGEGLGGEGTVGALAGGASPSNFPDDQSSIQTSPSLALQDETALVRNSSTDTSMETQSTNNHTNHHRPTSITVTFCSESVTTRSHSRY